MRVQSIYQTLVSSCSSPDLRDKKATATATATATSEEGAENNTASISQPSVNDSPSHPFPPPGVVHSNSTSDMLIEYALRHIPCANRVCGLKSGFRNEDDPNMVQNNNDNIAMFRASSEVDRMLLVPLNSLVVADVRDLESISELTMRSGSHYHYKLPTEDRRMAYYAIGKRVSGYDYDDYDHSLAKVSQRQLHGNRRCYFTGKLIASSMPFYAGSVQQGLRTLVVLCLPSSIGLLSNHKYDSSTGQCLNNVRSMEGKSPVVSDKWIRSSSTRQSSYSSVGYSASCNSGSIIEEMNLNDAIHLYETLPKPSDELITNMKHLYPEQFTTLPVHVRSPHCWRLYMKFCYFSGIPIGEDEPHYRIKDEYNEYGEDINLSHEVIEISNGEESAALLRRPNRTTFRYLQNHYTQQCSKLHRNVLDRKCWEPVLAEV